MSTDRSPIRISVLISTYNRAQYLAQCLDSLLAQTRPPDEILVIDDGSTDDTPAIAQRYADRIRYKRQENQGKSVALNGAIPEALGTHICVFDDDDVMLPDALAQHEAYLGAHPDIDYSYSGKYFFEDYPGQTHDIWEQSEWRIGQLDACPPEELLIKTMEWNGTLMQGMLVPVRCITDVGMFDASMLRTQDYDMMLKLARRFRGASIDAITFVHRNHGGARGPGRALHDEKKRNAVWHDFDRRLFRKIRSDYALAEFLPASAHFGSRQQLTREDEFNALYQRAKVMFARGLYREGALDVVRLLQSEPWNEDQFKLVRGLILNAANISHRDYAGGAREMAHELRRSKFTPRSEGIVSAAMKGLYWTMIRAAKQRWIEAAPQLLSAISLLLVWKKSKGIM